MNEVNDGLPEKQRTLAIITVILAVVISVLDGSIANLALPSIAVDMQATASEAIWIINSYQIAMAICLLPLASLGEIIGYRRIYMTGLALFTVASLACSVSGTMLELSLARVLQGIGAAGILSVNVALLRFIYPRRLLGRAIGYNALIVGAANAMGPTIAGAILHVTTWHWLFLINIPLGILAGAIGWRSLPDNPLSKHPYDKKSAVLCMIFVGMMLYSVDAIGHLSSIVHIGGGVALTLVALFWLLKIQSRSAPMWPLDLLRIPIFFLSICTSMCSFASQTAGCSSAG